MEKRCSFELFKSNVCHRLKEQGDIDFLIETLKEDMIRQYYDKKWYPESFYLLAMVDYISRENNVPICNDYDDLRQQKMQKMIYPVGILITASVLSDDSVKEDAYHKDSKMDEKRIELICERYEKKVELFQRWQNGQDLNPRKSYNRGIERSARVQNKELQIEEEEELER